MRISLNSGSSLNFSWHFQTLFDCVKPLILRVPRSLSRGSKSFDEERIRFGSVQHIVQVLSSSTSCFQHLQQPILPIWTFGCCHESPWSIHLHLTSKIARILPSFFFSVFIRFSCFSLLFKRPFLCFIAEKCLLQILDPLMTRTVVFEATCFYHDLCGLFMPCTCHGGVPCTCRGKGCPCWWTHSLTCGGGFSCFRVVELELS